MLPQTGERQVAEKLEQIKPNHRQRYGFAISEIERLFGKDAELNILDAACGVGYGTMMLAQAFPNSTVVGIDIFPGAIEAATRAYKQDNNEFAVLDLAKEEDWEYARDHFDVIVSIETIEHVPDADSLIKRYASSAHTLVGSVPNEDIVPFDKDTHPFHFRHYTKDEFDELLKRHDLHIEKWATQYDKIPGEVYDADDGMGFIVTARRA
jgi:SAM-dependent methyltransferase